MYHAIVNGREWEIGSNQGDLVINGEKLDWDLIKVGDGIFHIIHKHRSFRAEVVKTDVASKTVTIKVNGHLYPVELKDKFDLLLEKMGMTSTASSKVNNIKAPMPGLIIDLKVKQGDAVKAGEQLLILEAMKMENIIKSPGEGVVKSVRIKKGDSVEKGQVLLEF